MQVNEPVSTPPPEQSGGHVNVGYLSTWEFILSCEVLVFGFVVLAVVFWLYRSRNATPDDILKTVAVVLIVIGSLFAMTAGFSSAQIAPIIGLFGTIIGYVIGRRSDSADNKADDQNGRLRKEEPAK